MLPQSVDKDQNPVFDLRGLIIQLAYISLPCMSNHMIEYPSLKSLQIFVV